MKTARAAPGADEWLGQNPEVLKIFAFAVENLTCTIVQSYNCTNGTSQSRKSNQVTVLLRFFAAKRNFSCFVTEIR